jgi:hypothetical protein
MQKWSVRSSGRSTTGGWVSQEPLAVHLQTESIPCKRPVGGHRISEGGDTQDCWESKPSSPAYRPTLHSQCSNVLYSNHTRRKKWLHSSNRRTSLQWQYYLRMQFNCVFLYISGWKTVLPSNGYQGIFPWVLNGRRVKLTSLLHLLQRLRLR